MSRRSILAVVCLTLAASTAWAQVTVGRIYPQGGTVGSSPGPYTAIDIMHPATGSGNLTRAVVRWFGVPGTPCPAAFKLKFLRPSLTAGNYVIVTERGPFTAVNGRNEVLLNPIVPVGPGDLISIVQLFPFSACGAFAQTYMPEVVSLTATVEIFSGANLVGTNVGLTPSIFASSDANSVVAILPAAGAAQGSNGSFFRTAVQITGTDFSPISGTIVYHPAGVPASPGDPSMPFSVGASQTISFPDIAAALGQSGLGSIDILTSGVTPLVSARIFNDAGDAGTSGFTEAAIAPTEAVVNLQDVYLRMPSDVTNFRMNVGVRTLGLPVNLTVVPESASGAFLTNPIVTAKSYPANYFEQTTAQAFAGLSSLAADGLLRIRVNGGRAIIYGTITDNRTNDSSIVFALPTR